MPTAFVPAPESPAAASPLPRGEVTRVASRGRSGTRARFVPEKSDEAGAAARHGAPSREQVRPTPPGAMRASPTALSEKQLDAKRASVARHPALSPLAEYLDDAAITDIFVNGERGVWVDRGAGAMRDPLWRSTESEVRDLAIALIAAGNRHLDEAHPCVDVRLDDGIRVHAVLPPVSSTGTLISVRVPSIRRTSLDHLHEHGMFGADVSLREWVRETARARQNILITGAAGSGKTTLLSAVLGEAAVTERIVTIEDVAELRLSHPHHIALESRQANLEGAGEISLARLVREALRMRPDRLVVGECRGAEVRELLSALNTGHDGGAGTLHANGLLDVSSRLEALGALAGMDDHALARQAVSAFDLVLHLERDTDGERRLARVGELALEGGRLRVDEVTPWLR